MNDALTVEELNYLTALNRQSPIGDERFDYLFAQLCLVVCMAGGARKRGGGPFKLDDFLMFKKRTEPTAFEAMQSMFGSRVVKGKPPKRKKS